MGCFAGGSSVSLLESINKLGLYLYWSHVLCGFYLDNFRMCCRFTIKYMIAILCNIVVIMNLRMLPHAV